MRKCIRCGEEMKENFVITSGYGIVICPEGAKLKAVKPKVSICPKCGEASIYVEELDKIMEK